MGSRVTAPENAEVAEQPHVKSWVREYAETILICVIFVIFCRAFVFQQSEIPSGSMEDTILEGDYILVNRFQYAPAMFAWERALLPSREIRRGDIVVFKRPAEPETDYIKRVIGLPGESIEVHRDYVWVDGKFLDEPYVGPLYRRGGNARGTANWATDQPAPVPRSRFPEGRIPQDHYLMMGDHRNRSSDSREFGPVHKEAIKGRAFMILFSTRAKHPPGTQPGMVTVGSLGRKIINLVFRNRVDRAFAPIR